MPTLLLEEVRPAAGVSLAPVNPGDPAVLTGWVDSVEPPALILGWDDPWLEPAAGFGPCVWTARFAVLAIAGRLEPGAGIDELERLVSLVVARLQADAYPWPVARTQAPASFKIGGVPYLGALVTYGVPVEID